MTDTLWRLDAPLPMGSRLAGATERSRPRCVQEADQLRSASGGLVSAVQDFCPSIAQSTCPEARPAASTHLALARLSPNCRAPDLLHCSRRVVVQIGTAVGNGRDGAKSTSPHRPPHSAPGPRGHPDLSPAQAFPRPPPPPDLQQMHDSLFVTNKAQAFGSFHSPCPAFWGFRKYSGFHLDVRHLACDPPSRQTLSLIP